MKRILLIAAAAVLLVCVGAWGITHPDALRKHQKVGPVHCIPGANC